MKLGKKHELILKFGQIGSADYVLLPRPSLMAAGKRPPQNLNWQDDSKRKNSISNLVNGKRLCVAAYTMASQWPPHK